VLVNHETGITLATLTGHTGRVRAVAFSPDGATVATGAEDTKAKLWDASTGALLFTLDGGAEPVYYVEFSPDGTRLVGAGLVSKVWDVATGSVVCSLAGQGGIYAEFSPDGATILSPSGDDAKLWNAETGALLQTFTGHTGTVNAARFFANGLAVVTASDDNTMKSWVVSDGSPLDTLTGHTGPVYAIALSADGTRLTSASGDSTVKLWNTDTGALLKTFTGHTGGVVALAYIGSSIDAVYLLHGPEVAPGQALGRYVVIQPDTDLRVDKVALQGPGALGITGSVILHFAQRVCPVDLQPSEALETLWHNVSVMLRELLADPAFQAAKPEEISMTAEDDPDPFVAVRVSVTLAAIEPEVFDS
jgi:WD40 repeat protein